MSWFAIGASKHRHVLLIWLETIDQTIDLADGTLAELRGDEVFYYGVAVLMEMLSGLLNAELQSLFHANRNCL